MSKLGYCPICGETKALTHRLYDKNRKQSGDYCSAECANADAWGPRFNPYKVRKLPDRQRTK